MSPDDPRHGTYAGASAHYGAGESLCGPCAAAYRRYRKRRNLDTHEGRPRTIPARGTARRIRALQALGWSMPQIAADAGLSARTLWHPVEREHTVTATVAAAVAAAYDRLSMTVPTGGYAHRSRLAAQRKGWAPPLAWDDIDSDPEPATAADPGVDEVLVDRVVAGQHHLVKSATRAERVEVVARFRAAGLALRPLELAGIEPRRYFTKEEAA